VNLVSGFRATGIMSFNRKVALESQFGIDPIDSAQFTLHRPGAEVNEIVLTFPSGLDFRCRHELRKVMEDADHDLINRHTSEDLKRNSVAEGRPLLNSPSMFLG
jgi:hypothetical protein